MESDSLVICSSKLSVSYLPGTRKYETVKTKTMHGACFLTKTLHKMQISLHIRLFDHARFSVSRDAHFFGFSLKFCLASYLANLECQLKRTKDFSIKHLRI